MSDPLYLYNKCYYYGQRSNAEPFFKNNCKYLFTCNALHSRIDSSSRETKQRNTKCYMSRESELMKARRKALKDAGLVKSEVWTTLQNKPAVMALDERDTVSNNNTKVK